MNQIQSQVKEFMAAVGQSMPDSPSAPDYQTRELRVRLLLEEVLEFAEASGVYISPNGCRDCGEIKSVDDFVFRDSGEVDLLEVADALADINYVSYGAANQYGIDPSYQFCGGPHRCPWLLWQQPGQWW